MLHEEESERELTLYKVLSVSMPTHHRVSRSYKAVVLSPLASVQHSLEEGEERWRRDGEETERKGEREKGEETEKRWREGGGETGEREREGEGGEREKKGRGKGRGGGWE